MPTTVGDGEVADWVAEVTGGVVDMAGVGAETGVASRDGVAQAPSKMMQGRLVVKEFKATDPRVADLRMVVQVLPGVEGGEMGVEEAGAEADLGLNYQHLKCLKWLLLRLSR